MQFFACSYYPDLANWAAWAVLPTEHLGAPALARAAGIASPAHLAHKRYSRIHEHVADISCTKTATLVSLPAAGRRSRDGVQTPADSAGLASYPFSTTVTRARARPIEQPADATLPAKTLLEVHFSRIRVNGNTHIDQNDGELQNTGPSPAQHVYGSRPQVRMRQANDLGMGLLGDRCRPLCTVALAARDHSLLHRGPGPGPAARDASQTEARLLPPPGMTEDGEDEGAARAMRILGACALDDGSILREGTDLHHYGPSMSRARLRAYHIALLLAATVQLEDWRTSRLVGRACWGGFISCARSLFRNALLTVNFFAMARSHRADILCT
ncbi:hypothetical protein AURDEDRAFT_174122 [Auricularia subglabra TFB-10046 SS5]|nr:hypothetical protein AURDEDRAFT_174122 [Auricularia subglabra TFB-10046 SS5]